MTASPRSDIWARGLALLRDGKAEAAEALYRPLLPHPEASLGVARSFHIRSMHAHAQPFYAAAIAGLSDPVPAQIDAAAGQIFLDNPEKSLELLADLPPVLPVLSSRLAALRRLDRLEALLATARACLRLAPDHAAARFAEGTALMRLGRLREGWAAFERSWALLGEGEYAARPLWLGEGDIRGRTLLLHAEQGLGDTLQFVRYAPLLRRRGARVLLRVQPPLRRLLAPLADAICTHDEPIPPHDLHIPLMRLPFALGTTLSSIPAAIPYLHADPAAVAAWRTRLAALPGRKLGLVWAGAAHPVDPDLAEQDRHRSLPQPALAALLELVAREAPDITLISLQKHQPAAAPLIDWTADLHDFADTASLVAALDLVVSVDTSVAHLAGALGKPVWLLNRFDGCWRWLRGRDDCPWYPTLRQFRQPAPGDWGSPLAALARALAA